MPIPSHLLERAYQLIDANQFDNAKLVLDAVVRVDPQNVEAWRIYLRIHQNRSDLDWLKERILKTQELSESDKSWLLDYYFSLAQQMNETHNLATHTYSSWAPNEKGHATPEENVTAELELLDIFDYPTMRAKRETITSSYPKVVYNPHTLHMPQKVQRKVRSSRVFEKAIAAYYQKMITWGRDLIQTSMDAYARLSKRPHFEKYILMALLTLFVMGVRLSISGWIFGYIFLGTFLIGSGWWLLNFGNNNSGQSRVYLHEHKISLPEIKPLESKQEQEDDKTTK
jgi:hypothetical protein